MQIHDSTINKKTIETAEDYQTMAYQAVIDLHISRRNLLIYPISHEQVKRSIIRAFKSLMKVMMTKAPVTLAVMKDGIHIRDQVLGMKNSVIMDFAGLLKHYEIATLTFNEGIKIQELARFLRVISVDREKIMANGGIAAVIRERNFSCIQVQAVDYSKLQFTEEHEIHGTSGQSSKNESVWQQFVSNLISTQSDQDRNVDSSIDPGHLAEMINQQAIDINHAVDHYQSSLARIEVDWTGNNKTAKEFLAFQQMIKELNVELKMQFLSATFERCGQMATISEAAHLIDGLGAGLIVEMLRHANSEGKKISPSLLAFIRKMGHLNDSEGMQIVAQDIGIRQKELSSKNVESLLAHEKYDTYVESGYGELLDHLTHDAPASNLNEISMALVQEIETQLTDSNVHIHIGRSITRLMSRSADATQYRDWARQLAYLMDDLLESHAYTYLTQLLEFLRGEVRNTNNEHAEIAKLVLDRFSDPQFVAKAVEIVQMSMGEADPEAIAFLMELGEPVVVEIFDCLDPNQTFHCKGILDQILHNLEDLTVKEALERVKDPNPDYVRQMIRIIRKMGDREKAQQIRALTDHEDLNVRMEALATLLKFSNNWGFVHLRELLDNPSGEAFAKAAELAGRYRVQSAVSQLAEVAVQRGEHDCREAAIRALGQIGDPKAIRTLSKIARRRWGLAKKNSRRLKRIVYDTLWGYPSDTIQDLVRYGLKQKDTVIQSACQQLLRKGGQTAIQSTS